MGRKTNGQCGVRAKCRLPWDSLGLKVEIRSDEVAVAVEPVSAVSDPMRWKENMASRNWLSFPGQFVYQRPYEDAWGVLHDPTTEWDELLKNYKSWVMLLQVGDGTRRMAQPASIGAGRMIRREQQHRAEATSRINALEGNDLDKINRRKHWKRRQKKKLKSNAATQLVAATGA